ncbi:MAG: cell wall metabolism sensor histidine kinase WalK [PVC group bacterium]|nr:cell wall metabolism sensor histidine kinase WalK [PVC group bacterium]
MNILKRISIFIENAWLSKKKRIVQQEKDIINSVLHKTAEGLVVVDKEGKVLALNSAAERLLDVSMKDKVGQHILDGLREDCVYSYAEKKQKYVEIETAGGSSKTRQILRASTAIVENEQGQTLGVLSGLNDVTKQRELDQMKNKFVSQVSHDLKAPLISIEKSIEMVLEEKEKLDPQHLQFLEMACRNARRLRGLVSDILDVEKLENSKAKLNFTKIDIKDVIDDVLKVLDVWAKNKNVSIVREDISSIDLEADSNRLRQVFTNIVGNGIKFSAEGGRVNISVLAEQDWVEIMIKDTGCGIPAEQLGQIFDKFEQIQTVVTMGDHRGIGLGLAIAKEIVELHGGNIKVKSELGKGSSFTVRLPLNHLDAGS